MQLELELAELRTFLSDYDLDDIYNVDETGLFWKLLPDRTLASEQLPGGKLHKQRISVALCCNASGTHKLDPWVIHNRQTPRCFGYKGIKIHTLPLEWRANKKAWMTGRIFKDFLIYFNREIGGPESGDKTPQVTPVSLSEALAGLATLRLYEEQQQDGSRDLIRTLNRFERELQGKRANRGAQTQIDSYFQP